jgi:hypothetical protein
MPNLARESRYRPKGVGQNIKNCAQTVQPNHSRSVKLGFLAVALGAIMSGASICSRAADAQAAIEPIWPTKGWRTSSPEEQGIDSKEIVKLLDFGTTHSFDSLLIVRHGKIDQPR